MASALIDYETLNAEQIGDIMAGAKPRAPSGGSSGPVEGGGEEPKGGAPSIGGPAEEV
jgi:hypothetical protein